LYFYDTLDIKTRGDIVNSRTLPFILSGIMLFLGILQFISALNKIERKISKEYKDYLTVIKAAFIIVIYTYAFESIGFIIMTILFLFFMFCVLTPDVYKANYSIYLIVSISVSMAVYLVFRYGLDVLLPQGLISVI